MQGQVKPTKYSSLTTICKLLFIVVREIFVKKFSGGRVKIIKVFKSSTDVEFNRKEPYVREINISKVS